jgi:hypothetical protein
LCDLQKIENLFDAMVLKLGYYCEWKGNPEHSYLKVETEDPFIVRE